MLELSGYQTVEQLVENTEMVGYRLVHVHSPLSVIGVAPVDEQPHAAVLEAYRREYELLRILDGRGAVKPIGLEYTRSRPVLLTEDFGGVPLSRLLHPGQGRRQVRPIFEFGMVQLLTVAVSLANCLKQLHRQQVIHNAIHPEHILVNPNTLEVRLSGLGHATFMSDPSAQPAVDGWATSMLPYISPEQTGRLNRQPDYRTDFYSLGVTLYEWFSGHLPFEAKDMLELVHAQLAGKPVPLCTLEPIIPEPLSNLVDKCLQKAPEDRFRSAHGLETDLQTCLTQLQQTGTIAPMALAGSDVPEQWQMPPTMYGRSAEQAVLLQLKAHITAGESELLLVHGPTGVGKTTFVRETLRGQIGHGLFISGKFDPDPSDTPYAAWNQAIQELVRQLLTGTERQIEVWRLRIRQTLGDYGQLLTRLVPQLELLIGPQPDIQPLPPMEARGRFHHVLGSFIQLFADAEHPLIVFLDDLQWADEASLQFMTHLLLSRRSLHLLLIGAYREDELPSHPTLRQMEALWELRHKRLERLPIRPLEAEAVMELLADTMPSAAGNLHELTTVVMQKTAGHPLFIRPFLQNAYDRKWIFFHESTHSWQWNLKRLEAMEAPERAIGHWVGSLDDLPAETVRLLIWAAFLGREFDLEALTQVGGLSLQEAAAALEPAERGGLLQRAELPSETGRFNFQHDRIRQDCIKLIPQNEQAPYHYEVGLLMKNRLASAPETDTGLHETVYHLNTALSCIRTAVEKQELAELNARAGFKAKQSTAYETAMRYYRQATELLGESGWEENFELMFHCSKEQSECEFLCGYLETAESLFRQLLARAPSWKEQVDIHVTMIQMENNSSHYKKVIELDKQALLLLGFQLPAQPSALDLLRMWAKIKWRMHGRSIESLRSLPPMTDPRIKAALVILTYSGHAKFMEQRNYWTFSVLTMIELTLRYGQTAESAIAYVGMTLIQSLVWNNYREGYEWGKLASTISDSHTELRSLVSVAFSLSYDSWRRYEPDLLAEFSLNAERARLESASLWHVKESALLNCSLMFLFGKPLDDVYRQLIRNAPEFSRSPSSNHWNSMVIMSKLIVRLTGEAHPHDPFLGSELPIEAGLQNDTEEHDNFGLQALSCMYHYITNYLFGDIRSAYAYVTKARELFRSMNISESIFEYSSLGMYHVLILSVMYPEATVQEQRSYLRLMRKNRDYVKKYAAKCPENYQHKYRLMAAEIARITHKDEEAGRLFELACLDAEQFGFTHDTGIIAECAAKFYLSRGKQQLAKAYMTKAYEAYVAWGAKAKVADLAVKYRHLLPVEPASAAGGVDDLAIMKTVQAISGEVIMSRLLDMLMRILLQNAGAENGALIFEHDGHLVMEAYGTIEDIHLHPIPLDQTDLISSAIVGYVARTHEEVVLEHASAQSIFSQSPYVRDKQLKSVLCLPILKNGELVCILYLENNLSTGVFTSGRLGVLKLLCSQCAISIDNAKLYRNIEQLKDSLEEQVVERTRTLEQSMRETAAALAEVSIQSERNRIAAEVHDIVGHTLTSTILQIEASKRQFHKDQEGAFNRLQGAQDLIRHGLNEIRRSVHMLKSYSDVDFTDALLKLIGQTEQNTGVQVKAELAGLPGLLGTHRHAIYHALQEGLTNGIRHGGATEFTCSLTYDGKFLLFRLDNNGRGLQSVTPGFGLTAMRERIEALDGTLTVYSPEENGFSLRIAIPHSTPLEARIHEEDK
ncbi:AAA family ATPase [Paenibacillus filicis]|uniref:AAA family ATPase n=1 Tax=Paenibacillus filicis TaxID=669464 RepID=A0ABU9DVP1_9BACL